ncbi:hypothetical protein ACIBR0_28165, partial [Micromonospora sp. NPDC049497]
RRVHPATHRSHRSRISRITSPELPRVTRRPLAGAVLDGEFVVWEGERTNFSQLQRWVTAGAQLPAMIGRHPAHYVVFDLLRASPGRPLLDLLVAVQAVEAGAVTVPLDHPDIVRWVDQTREQPGPWEQSAPRQIEWSGAGSAILRPDWTVEVAWLLDSPSYDGEPTDWPRSGSGS